MLNQSWIPGGEAFFSWCIFVFIYYSNEFLNILLNIFYAFFHSVVPKCSFLNSVRPQIWLCLFCTETQKMPPAEGLALSMDIFSPAEMIKSSSF